MFGDLKACEVFALYVLSCLVCGSLFFYRADLSRMIFRDSIWRKPFSWFVLIPLAVVSAMMAITMLFLLFVKAFWWAVVGFVVLVVALWFITK